MRFFMGGQVFRVNQDKINPVSSYSDIIAPKNESIESNKNINKISVLDNSNTISTKIFNKTSNDIIVNTKIILENKEIISNDISLQENNKNKQINTIEKIDKVKITNLSESQIQFSIIFSGDSISRLGKSNLSKDQITTSYNNATRNENRFLYVSKRLEKQFCEHDGYLDENGVKQSLENVIFLDDEEYREFTLAAYNAIQLKEQQKKEEEEDKSLLSREIKPIIIAIAKDKNDKDIHEEGKEPIEEPINPHREELKILKKIIEKDEIKKTLAKEKAKKAEDRFHDTITSEKKATDRQIEMKNRFFTHMRIEKESRKFASEKMNINRARLAPCALNGNRKPNLVSINNHANDEQTMTVQNITLSTLNESNDKVKQK